MMKKSSLTVAALVAGVGMAAGVAHAGPVYGFYRITNNGAQNVASQLTVEVNDAGGGQVDFTFRNAGPLASSITDVYFDDGTLLGIAQVFNGPGTSFTPPATPSNLPGGSGIGFETTAGFSADSDAPITANGINPGEWMTIRFDLINGQTFADTIAAIDAGFANNGGEGTLRIGIHVQGLPDGQSDGFVNDGGPVIPLPSASMMGLAGLAVVARRRRRLA